MLNPPRNGSELEVVGVVGDRRVVYDFVPTRTGRHPDSSRFRSLVPGGVLTLQIGVGRVRS